MDKSFSDINHTNVFLGQSPKAIEIKMKINKWNQIKLTNFCTAKETTNKTKRPPTEWEKIFANNATDEHLIFKIYKQFTQLDNRKTENPIEKRTEDLKRYHSKEETARRSLTAFLRPPKVPRHAGFPRGEHRGSRHRFL